MDAEGSKGQAAVTRAVIAIYKRQTTDEQRAMTTNKTNNVGFNQADANYLSYCAQYAIKHRRELSGKHLAKARGKIKKYWKQLCEIANENEQRKADKQPNKAAGEMALAHLKQLRETW